MATAKEFNQLLMETNRTIKAIHLIQDYVGLVNNHKADLAEDIVPTGDRIKNIAEDLGKEIDAIRLHITAALNKLEINLEECEYASKNMLLYYSSIEQAIQNASASLAGAEKGGYWFRYWTEVMKNLNVIERESQENPEKQETPQKIEKTKKPSKKPKKA